MRAVLVVFLVALCATAVLSQVSRECVNKLQIKKDAIKSPEKTEEQIDCLYSCFMQGAGWLKPDGTFNRNSLNSQSETRRELALAIVRLCTDYAKNRSTKTCAFPGCLRKNRLALAYS